MPIYKYKATQTNGATVQGERTADSREMLAQNLQSQGLMVISIEEKIAFNLQTLNEIQIGDISLKEKVFFVKQLAAMLGAGLPVVQALEILLDQSKSSSIKTKLNNVYKDVKSGLSLSVSFGKHNLIFDELQLSLIQAGEQSGNMVEIIKQISFDMQKSHQLKGKVRGALIYPAVIVVTAIIVIIVLVIFMIPAVENLYVDLGASEDDIPGITKFLVTISNFFTNPFGIIITMISVVAGVIGFRSYYSTEFGRLSIDKLLLRMPIFGDLIGKMQVLQMTRLLGMLLKSGIPIVDALKSTANAMGNIHYQNVLLHAADRVSKGSPLAVSLVKGNIVPIMVIKMIATGEDTGSLDLILADLTKFFEDEVEEITSNLTKLMEPLMLLIVGGLVAFLAIAVYLPIYSIANFT
jgi:type IV pilus assembly protein PilC